MNRLGVAAASRGQFGEVFARSATAAGLAESTGDSKITLLAKPQDRSSDDEIRGSVDHLPGGITPVPEQPVGRWAHKPVLDQHWPFPDGEVALAVTISRPLSAADFASIGSVVAEIEKLVAGLSGGGGNA